MPSRWGSVASVPVVVAVHRGRCRAHGTPVGEPEGNILTMHYSTKHRCDGLTPWKPVAVEERGEQPSRGRRGTTGERDREKWVVL